MKTLILNDLHLGVHRKGGTTPASQEALRAYMFNSLRKILNDTSAEHLIVNGDLFDRFSVDTRDLLETYAVFMVWLGLGKKLTLCSGNHDTVNRGDQVSSFSALGAVLTGAYPSSVVVVDINQTAMVLPRVFAIPHQTNQDVLDGEFEKALLRADEYDTLLLHCNLDNFHAQQSDLSLDLSDGMARRFEAAGVKILLAHEHDSRTVRNVTVLGCQLVSSIADCVKSPAKFAHILEDGQIERVQTWSADGVNGYAQIDWRDLAGHTGEQSFLRVSGEAKSSEAAEVINAIAKFRLRSKAFVISNAVAIDGIVSAEELPANFEAVKAFDVVRFVHRHLDDREKATFDSLLGQQT